MNEKLLYEDESYAIRGAIYEVYKTLGCGHLEEVYQNALEEELSLRGIPFVAKKPLLLEYGKVYETCGARKGNSTELFLALSHHERYARSKHRRSFRIPHRALRPILTT